MQLFSQYSGIQLYLCLGKLFITAIIFSLEKGELGKKIHIRIGEMSDFVRKKTQKAADVNGKEPSQRRVHLMLAMQSLL